MRRRVIDAHLEEEVVVLISEASAPSPAIALLVEAHFLEVDIGCAY